MAYTFDSIFAADPSNAANVASNAAITIFDPNDPGKAPITITDPTDSPISNPITVNKNGFGPAFKHATLDRVGWSGGGFEGFFTSYEGIKNVALEAQAAAEAAGATAAAEAAAGVAPVVAEAEAAAADAAAAQAAAAASATAAANSAALVNAPADSAIAAAINGSATQTKAALSATIATAVDAEEVRADAAYPRKVNSGYDEFQAVDAEALRPWWAALANREYGAADVAFLGDSLTELYGASTHGRQYVSKFRDRLRQKFPVTGATGGYNIIPSYFTQAYSGSPVTTVGAPGQDNTFGWGFKGLVLASGKSVTFTANMTSGRVAYVQMAGQGTFSISVDGGAATTVDANNATTNYFQTTQPANLTGLDGNSHTVTVAGVSGNVYIAGLINYNGDESKGIRVWNGGHSGKRAEQFALSGGWAPALAFIQPDLVVIELGLNDQNTRTAAQYKADLLTIISKVRAQTTVPPSILLLAAYKRGDITPPNTWDSYRTAMKEIADSDALVSYLDLSTRFLDSAAASATYAQYALINSDLLHPTDRGHALMADLLVSNISPR